MSFLKRSSCLILEFVAMGRDEPSSRTGEDEDEDNDGFRLLLLPLASDL